MGALSRDEGLRALHPRRRRARRAGRSNNEETTASTKFKINGKTVVAQSEPDTPLLWVIRDEIGLTGTKFGCGAVLCGACTVHLDGAPIRSCSTPGLLHTPSAWVHIADDNTITLISARAEMGQGVTPRCRC